jgi:hypothetical protein
MHAFPKSFQHRPKPEPINLTNIRIASPCPADWNKMVGDERVRHCAECNLNVYNLSAMTERQIQELIADNRGKRLCARFYRRADGTVLMQDCPWSLRTLKRRASRVASAIVSAVLSVGAAKAQTLPQIETQSTGTSHDQRAELVVIVLDPQDAVISNATVTLTKSKSQIGDRPQAIRTDGAGKIRLGSLSPGEYRIAIEAKYFKAETHSFRLEAAKSYSLTVTLKIDPKATTTVEVGGVEIPLIQNQAQVSTTFDMDR